MGCPAVQGPRGSGGCDHSSAVNGFKGQPGWWLVVTCMYECIYIYIHMGHAATMRNERLLTVFDVVVVVVVVVGKSSVRPHFSRRAGSVGNQRANIVGSSCSSCSAASLQTCVFKYG